MKISKERVLQIIKEEVEAYVKEARLGGSLDDISDPGDHPFFTKKPRSWTLQYRETGYRGRRIIPRDRAWLEFVPKGDPSRTKPDMFRSVTKLKAGDPEIQRHLDRNSYAMSSNMSKAMENIDQYDVYSVYATTTG